MAEEYIYEVARVHNRDTSLLTGEFMRTLAAQEDEASALKLLHEKGWGSPDLTSEEMFAEEQKETWEFITELLKGKISDLDIFRTETDYHNLKAAVKESVRPGIHEGIFQDGGRYKAMDLYNAISDSSWESLPDEMQSCAKKAKETLLTTGDGQMCDVIIDRACMEQLQAEKAETDQKILKDYAELKTVAGDISIAVRSARTGKSRAFLEAAMAPAETIDREELIRAALEGTDSIYAYLASTDYADAVPALTGSMAAFECWCDNRLVEAIRPEAHQYFGIGPLAAYILARQNEIKTVRILLSAKRNNFPEEEIKERIRETYV